MSDSWNPSREEVIEGLERLQFFNQRAGRELWADKSHDVQEKDIANADAVYADAIALLKEQEPRVLTLDEVRYEYEVVWLETKYLSPTVCLFDNVESNVDWLYFVFGSDDSYGESVHLYGKNWRCWSAKPTDEQRRAVPWTE